jgi:hypothetical protein
MNIQAAVVQDQGQTFAVVVVKKRIVDSQHQSSEAINSFASLFPNMPITLMAQDNNGTPTYRGRRDIVNFLSKLQISQIPWKEYRAS